MSIVNKILLEAGDLQNIGAVKIINREKNVDSTSSFALLGENKILRIEFSQVKSMSYLEFPINIVPDNVFACAFTVNENDIQYEPTDLKAYLVILKTVMNEIEYFLKTVKPDAFIFTGNNKSSSFENEDNDSTKSKMYKAMAKNGLSRFPNYDFVEIEYYGIKYSCVYKKELLNKSNEPDRKDNKTSQTA